MELVPQWPIVTPETPLEASQRFTEGATALAGNVVPPPCSVPAETITKPRILFLDIETRPNLMYVWNVWKPGFNDAGLVESKQVISFAASWEGKEEKEFWSVYHDGKAVMLSQIHLLLDQADFVVHYYGKKHDIPHLNREFILANKLPPSPYKQIDLCEVVKNKFSFEYNSLDHVCRQLKVPAKAGKPGFENWIKCLQDDPVAWNIVMEYNIQDVVALKALYYKLRPWIHNHPSHAPFSSSHVCPNCGEKSLQRRGYAYTQVSQFQRWRCNDCGAWSRTTKRNFGVEVTTVAG